MGIKVCLFGTFLIVSSVLRCSTQNRLLPYCPTCFGTPCDKPEVPLRECLSSDDTEKIQCVKAVLIDKLGFVTKVQRCAYTPYHDNSSVCDTLKSEYRMVDKCDFFEPSPKSTTVSSTTSKVTIITSNTTSKTPDLYCPTCYDSECDKSDIPLEKCEYKPSYVIKTTQCLNAVFTKLSGFVSKVQNCNYYEGDDKNLVCRVISYISNKTVDKCDLFEPLLEPISSTVTYPTSKPTASSSKPPTSSSKPPTSSSNPTTSSSKPTASSSNPTTSSSKPTASSSKPPTSSSKPPTSSSKPPTSSSKPPTSSSKPPTSSSKPTTSTSKLLLVLLLLILLSINSTEPNL